MWNFLCFLVRFLEGFEIVGRGNEAVCPNGLKRKMKVKCKGFGGSMYLDSMNLPSLQKKVSGNRDSQNIWQKIRAYHKLTIRISGYFLPGTSTYFYSTSRT